MTARNPTLSDLHKAASKLVEMSRRFSVNNPGAADIESLPSYKSGASPLRLGRDLAQSIVRDEATMLALIEAAGNRTEAATALDIDSAGMRRLVRESRYVSSLFPPQHPAPPTEKPKTSTGALPLILSSASSLSDSPRV